MAHIPSIYADTNLYGTSSVKIKIKTRYKISVKQQFAIAIRAAKRSSQTDGRTQHCFMHPIVERVGLSWLIDWLIIRPASCCEIVFQNSNIFLFCIFLEYIIMRQKARMLLLYDFQALPGFRSLQQHVDGCVWLATRKEWLPISVATLVVTYKVYSGSWNHCPVTSILMTRQRAHYVWALWRVMSIMWIHDVSNKSKMHNISQLHHRT